MEREQVIKRDDELACSRDPLVYKLLLKCRQAECFGGGVVPNDIRRILREHYVAKETDRQDPKTTEYGIPSPVWIPTIHLRYVREWMSDERTTHRLQQLWTATNDGEVLEEWRDIEVKEEK